MKRFITHIKAILLQNLIIYLTYLSDLFILPTLPQSLAIIEANKKTSKVKSKLIIFLQIGLLTNLYVTY